MISIPYAQNVGAIAVGTLVAGYTILKLQLPNFAQGNQDRLFDSIAWRVDPASGVTAGAVQPYELCLDGSYRPVGSPQSITAASVYGIIAPTSFLGFALVVSTSFATAGILYAEARGTTRRFAT